MSVFNIENIMLVENPCKTVCISTVHHRLTEIDNAKWYQIKADVQR